MHTKILKVIYIRNDLLHVSTNHVVIAGKFEKWIYPLFSPQYFRSKKREHALNPQDRSPTLSPDWTAGKIARFLIAVFLSF